MIKRVIISVLAVAGAMAAGAYFGMQHGVRKTHKEDEETVHNANAEADEYRARAESAEAREEEMADAIDDLEAQLQIFRLQEHLDQGKAEEIFDFIQKSDSACMVGREADDADMDIFIGNITVEDIKYAVRNLGMFPTTFDTTSEVVLGAIPCETTLKFTGDSVIVGFMGHFEHVTIVIK